MLGRTEWYLSIDDPALSAQWPEHRKEAAGLVQSNHSAEDVGMPRRMCCPQSLEEQPAEQGWQHMNGQEEAGPAGNPA
jgi:hypothetical protein